MTQLEIALQRIARATVVVPTASVARFNSAL